MNSTTRLISSITLLVAVVLACIALFILNNKDLARILFAAVLIVGYGSILVRWWRSKQ